MRRLIALATIAAALVERPAPRLPRAQSTRGQKLCLRQSGTFDSDAAIYYVFVSSSFFTLQQQDQARRLCEPNGGTFSGSASNYRCNGAS
jgi:hypothetical protein